MKDFISKIPKAELHIHIEGSLEPEFMFELAQRNGVKLPFDSVEAVRQAYNFSNLQSFLDVYYAGASVLLYERDFYDLTWNYLLKAASQNVRHTEIFFDAQTHTARGVPFETAITGIYKALRDGEENLGISSHIILCFLRHKSTEDAMAVFQQALKFQDWIIGVGLDSSEVGYPPALFAEVFSKARNAGFLTVAHAGEEGPPDYIWQALQLLQVSRIDHGVRCIEDTNLVHFLAEKQIPLTVCPLSNLKLQVFHSLAEHNLKKLLDLGLCVTVNSDDPAYFGGYIADNFEAAKSALNLNRNDICHLVKNSFKASFLSDSSKQSYLQELEDFMANW